MKNYVILMLFFVGMGALANELSEPKAEELDVYETARAISLDLRGKGLEQSELDALAATEEIDDALIDSWMQGSDFEEQVITHHRSLFWNKVSFYLNPDNRLRNYGSFMYHPEFPTNIYHVQYRTFTRRGSEKTGGQFPYCSNYPADVNELNQPQSWKERNQYGNEEVGGWNDEGYVWVNPWWDMDNPIKVCAYDAQLIEFTSTGTDCSTPASKYDSECGCGENLIWCARPEEQAKVVNGISAALSERVRLLLQNDRPYSELVTKSSLMMNGPMTYYYLNRASLSTKLISPVEPSDIPIMEPDDETWVEVPAGDHHAGVLTEPGWLLRHQTNRGRANRFYGAFLCKEFQPPPSGIMEIVEENPTPDLSRKPICKDCHVLLEPWTAYWGRWQEVGALYRSEDDYPSYSAECVTCSNDCPAYCFRNYLRTPTHPHHQNFIGWYTPYVFLLEEDRENPTIGPKKWAQEIVDDGRYARCASQNAAQWLMGWTTDEIQYDKVQEWADEFTAAGLDYRVLLRSIVTDPIYARAK